IALNIKRKKEVNDMNHLPVRTMVFASLLLFGIGAQAQDWRYCDYGRYQDNGLANRAARFFDRARADLDRAEDSALPFTGDRMRVSRAKQELNELQNSFNAGQMSDRELDDAVAALGRVVNSNRMNSRDRDNLREDLNRM